MNLTFTMILNISLWDLMHPCTPWDVQMYPWWYIYPPLGNPGSEPDYCVRTVDTVCRNSACTVKEYMDRNFFLPIPKWAQETWRIIIIPCFSGPLWYWPKKTFPSKYSRYPWYSALTSIYSTGLKCTYTILVNHQYSYIITFTISIVYYKTTREYIIIYSL